MSWSSFARRATRALAAGSVLLSAAGAEAVSAAVVRVDNDRAQCPAAQFRSIQAALDAVGPGDTVVVCPGAYVGPLRMDNRGVRLVGRTGRSSDVVVVPDSRDVSTPLVEMSAPATTLAAVTIRDRVVFDPAHEPCGPPVSVLVDNGTGPFAEASVVDGVTVRQRATPGGSACTFEGVGVAIGGADVGTRPGRAIVRRSTLAARIAAVEIHVASTASIHDNVIAGANTNSSPGINFSGIGVLAQGGVARIERNDVSGYIFGVSLKGGRATVGGPGQGNNFHNDDAAVLVFDDAAATIANNTMHANLGVGVATFGTHGTVVVSNVIRDNGGEGIVLTEGDLGGTRGAVVASNDVRRNGIGIDVGFLEKGNRILDNVAINNDGDPNIGQLPGDCIDASTGAATAGTANTWIGNVGALSTPPGICLPTGGLARRSPTLPPLAEPPARARIVGP